MLQNLTNGKMVKWVILLIALVALGLSIAAIVKPCKSDFAGTCEGRGCDSYAIGRECNNNDKCTYDAIIPSECVCNDDPPSTNCTPFGNQCIGPKNPYRLPATTCCKADGITPVTHPGDLCDKHLCGGCLAENGKGCKLIPDPKDPHKTKHRIAPCCKNEKDLQCVNDMCMP